MNPRTEDIKAVENAPTSGVSYYTVNRVCHLETRVLQARSHGQACSREHMHIQLRRCSTHAPHASPHTPPTAGRLRSRDQNLHWLHAINPKHCRPARQRRWLSKLDTAVCGLFGCGEGTKAGMEDDRRRLGRILGQTKRGDTVLGKALCLRGEFNYFEETGIVKRAQSTGDFFFLS